MASGSWIRMGASRVSFQSFRSAVQRRESRRRCSKTLAILRPISCGARIDYQVQHGQSVLVITVCAGDPPPGPLSPFADMLHARWQLPPSAVVSRRREEDIAAMARLGVDYEHWPVPDCIYRLDASGQPGLYASAAATYAARRAALSIRFRSAR